MAPKKKFSKEEIIDVAFNIAKEEGIDSITIRKVAQKLGSSIAPIYVNFNDIDELIMAVVEKTMQLSETLLKEQNSGEPFRDIGIASLRFAKEYSVLFRDLIVKNNPYMNYDLHNNDMIIEQMKVDPMLTGFTKEELQTILLKMRVFQTGLSTMIANGLLPANFDDEMAINMLDSVAADVINSARKRKMTDKRRS